MLNYYDEKGIYSKPRQIEFTRKIDVNGRGKIQEVSFTEDVFNCIATETQSETGTTYNDFYGFGSSFVSAFKDTGNRGKLKVKVISSLSILSPKHDKYSSGSIYLRTVPHHWLYNEASEGLLTTVMEYDIFKYGSITDDAVRFAADLIKIIDNDCNAEERRNKEWWNKSIANKKQELQTFLTIMGV